MYHLPPCTSYNSDNNTRSGSNHSLLQNFEPSPLTERGYVKVLPSLQLQSYPSKFALEDITDLQDAKQYQKTAGHASVVVWTRFENNNASQEERFLISNGRVSFFLKPSLYSFIFPFYSFIRTDASYFAILRSATFSPGQSSQKKSTWKEPFVRLAWGLWIYYRLNLLYVVGIVWVGPITCCLCTTLVNANPWSWQNLEHESFMVHSQFKGLHVPDYPATLTYMVDILVCIRTGWSRG